MKKKWIMALLLMTAFIPFVLFPQSQEGALAQEDENLVEVKTLQDLINSKEIDEEKKETVEPEKKEVQQARPEEKKTLPLEEKKEAVIPKEKVKPLKVPKQAVKNQNVFDGKLSQEDILAEKKGQYTVLWVKKKAQVYSVALLSSKSWNLKAKYFLRSTQKISEQKDNTLWYKGLPLGNEKKLYFLASSSTEKHPLLGKAFKIVVPTKVAYGYDKNYGEKVIAAGQTELAIRLFKKPQGQGTYLDNRYMIPLIEDSQINQPEIALYQKEKKIHLVGISFVYKGLSPNVRQITLETDQEEILLHDFVKNLTYPKYFHIVSWSYNKDSSLFKMKFIVIFNVKKNHNFILKVKDSKGTLSYPIDISKIEEEKPKEIEMKAEPGKKTEPVLEEKKEIPKNEVKKEEPKTEVKEEPKQDDEIKVEVKKEEPASDDLNLKVQDDKE